MTIDFSKSEFTTNYSFTSIRSIIRAISDSFSKQYCEVDEAIEYAAEKSKGKCIYCGKPMYKLKGNIPVFGNLIQYDHIYPVIKLNLFERGNVAISCDNCNLDKSDKLPMEYYDIRAANDLSLYIYDREEFEDFLNDMTKPYREKWPEFYKLNFMELNDDEFKEKLTSLMYNEVDISAATNRYNPKVSVNWPTWEAVVNQAYEEYTPSTAKDVEGRIGYSNELFEELFGHDKLLADTSISELSIFTTTLLNSKYESKNEIQKYRMLIKLLVQVLNEEIMSGQLEGFYKKVPTYSQLKKNNE